jgi:negative regulator of sigma E activity
MEEAEVPLEHVQEHVHETAKHSREAWMSWVALSTAILAVLAAIASLLSGEHANEAMINQIEASDQWSYYQAKSIKAAVLDAKTVFTGASSESDQSKRDRYAHEQEEIKSEARNKQAAAKSYFHKHEVFARGVTMFQIAIAIAAISALTKKRSFWVVSLLFGAFGCAFLVLAAMAR